jgi:superfamily II DNA or RNA helicase
MPRPDKRSALDCLARPRLLEIAAAFELDAPSRLKKDEIIDVIARSHRASFEAVLDQLKREELKDICRAHGLADGGKEKTALRDRILMRDAHVDAPSDAAWSLTTPAAQSKLAFAPAQVHLRDVLERLAWTVLAEAASGLEFGDAKEGEREVLVTTMVESGRLSLKMLLDEIPLDDLRALAKQYGLDGRARTRDVFVDGLLALATPAPASSPAITRPTDASTPSVSGPPPRASERSVLRTLNPARIAEIGRTFGLALNERSPRDRLVESVITTARPTLGDLLGYLTRDELRAACHVHGLAADDRARDPLVKRLLRARTGTYEIATELGSVAGEPPITGTIVPAAGDIVRCRERQYLVQRVVPEIHGSSLANLVDMVCLDDDDPGRPLQVIWELELGAQVIRPETGQLSAFAKLDDPRHFAAYLHAIKWNTVTASDAKLLQAPFRAGIAISPFQLVPLMKALELPRANLFIADDVGLGKTIEAGLVMQELLLRQRIEYILVVCPASVCLQWQEEMSKRFGLQFEIHDRSFVARRRRERGFATNPWGTHQRFIISYPLLRRPEYFEALRNHLDARGKGKTLLVLDEAHTVAPASASRYAVDSKVTQLVREQLGPRFENRLFLSATPHNGHSNSFSALLEILDPQRFMRGVPVEGPEQLRPVMIRRLKRDIKALTDEALPHRRVVQIDLSRNGDAWCSSVAGSGETPQEIGRGPAFELELATLLAEYSALVGPRTKAQKLVFIGLQKRLLSSVPAFFRTLSKHAAKFDTEIAPQLAVLAPEAGLFDADDEIDPDDEAIAQAEDAVVVAGSSTLEAPVGRARALLDQMMQLAAQGRGQADAKALALLQWIRDNQCAAASLERAPKQVDKTWSDRRVLIFTESVDTKRWLRQLLETAFRHTDRGDDRIAELHGAMPDDERETVQRAFNGPASQFPVRVLLATDAAREGVNLQGGCADLFHFDIPWNPARMEQRNGRIDRTLQPEPEVRCHYFCYRDRREDMVLQTLVTKVATIQDELGSLGTVIQNRLAAALESEGIGAKTADLLAHTEPDLAERAATSERELEGTRADLKRVDTEIRAAARTEVLSRKAMAFENVLLRDTIDVTLGWLGHGGLTPCVAEDGTAAYSLPTLPASWSQTLDSLRPARSRDEPVWEWRRRPPQPVVFEAPKTMTSPRVHLHLHHPFVRRVMDLLRAQGFGAHDLQRVTVVRDRNAADVRVLAFGRLSLFGRGAVRLHDALVTVVAPWDPERGPLPGTGARTEDERALFRLETLLAKPEALRSVSDRSAAEVLKRAASDFATLWSLVRDEADAQAHDAQTKLAQRGHDEAVQLTEILEGQRRAIERALADPSREQLLLPGMLPEPERRQLDEERKAMRERLKTIPKEIEREPAELEAMYRVQLRRLEPVGLVYLWPEGMA